MAKTDEWLTIPEAHEVLRMNGVEMTEAALRIGIVRNTIKSKKMFSSRVINKDEVSRIIGERRAQKHATGR